MTDHDSPQDGLRFINPEDREAKDDTSFDTLVTAGPEDVDRVLQACFTLSARHLLRELVATGPTQTVRLGRLVDMTTSLLRHREHAVAVSDATDGTDAGMHATGPDGTAIIPRPLPPHLIDLIRSLYGVELVVKGRQTDSPVNREP